MAILRSSHKAAQTNPLAQSRASSVQYADLGYCPNGGATATALYDNEAAVVSKLISSERWMLPTELQSTTNSASQMASRLRTLMSVSSAMAPTFVPNIPTREFPAND
jgi:hypothetical protein